MIPSIKEITDTIIAGILIHKNMGDKEVGQLLRRYGELIVHECAKRAATKSELWYNGKGGSESYDVIDEQSILKVLEDIK